MAIGILFAFACGHIDLLPAFGMGSREDVLEAYTYASLM